MKKIYLDQLYLPHFYIQGEDVSSRLSDMDTTQPIRLQIFNQYATELLDDGILTEHEIAYIRSIYYKKK